MKFPQPGVLTREPFNPHVTNVGGTYDAVKCGPQTVIKVGAGDYRLWYEGIQDTAPVDDQTAVCYATSSDGILWTKYGSNPIALGNVAWEHDEMSPTSVHRLSSTDYRMWYHGGNNSGPRQIGYATSSDGITWSKSGSNPVLTPGTSGQWDDSFIADCKVIRVSSSDYRMWYRGEKVSTGKAAYGYATSSDGIAWTKYGSNPVFTTGTAGQWDDDYLVALCPYMASATEFHAWYIASDGTTQAMGYAYSTDGISWTRGANNPVLQEITGSSVVDSVNVYVDGPNYRFTYGDYWLTGITQRAISGAYLPNVEAAAAWIKT